MSDSYEVCVSSRAKYVYLRMSIERGLQVIVPLGYDLEKIPSLIARKQKWIDRTLKRFAERKVAGVFQPIEKFPTSLELPAINETWRIEYVPSDRATVRLSAANGVLTLTGITSSEVACKRLLRRWLCCRASETLLPWLHRVSEEINLPSATSAVRLQKTRWGSCSHRKKISLNAKLLFLRPELVRYLFVHELCHLVHMNHSARYWNFVASKQSDYKSLDREMRHAMQKVPKWI